MQIKKDFVIDKQQETEVQKMDPSKPRMIKMKRFIRRIEQDSQARDRKDKNKGKVFDTVVLKKRPLDEYEKLQVGHSCQKNQQSVVNAKNKRAISKLHGINAQFEMLKKRNYSARRGRNNRIFYQQQLSIESDGQTDKEKTYIDKLMT